MRPNSNDRPDFVVVTVTLNAASVLQTTIDSVLSQNSDFRWVVWDGGSTDQTLELVRKAGKYRPIEILQGEDSGIFDAMNKAIDHLSDESFVLFMNAGDSFTRPDAVAKLRSAISEEGTVWGFAGVRIMEADGSLRGYPKFFPYSTQAHAFGRIFVYHQTVVIRMSQLRAVGRFPIRYPKSADFYVSLKTGLTHRPVVVNDVLVDYRAGGFSDRCLLMNITEQRAIRREVLPDSIRLRLRGDIYDLYRMIRISLGALLDRLAKNGLISTNWRAYRSGKALGDRGQRCRF